MRYVQAESFEAVITCVLIGSCNQTISHQESWSALGELPRGGAAEGKEEVMDGCECDPCDDKCVEAGSALKNDLNTHRSGCLSSGQEL